MIDHEPECCSPWRVALTYAQITAVSMALLVLAAGTCGLAAGVYMRSYYFMAGGP